MANKGRTKRPPEPIGNREVAERLEEVADLLEAHEANPFRVRAYRSGAAKMRALSEPVDELFHREGPAGLLRLPGIGRSLARAVEQLIHTGHFGLLDRLRGDGAPDRLLATVPGIGRELAGRIHEQLGVETLADLESAAWDGRLAEVPGMGRKRIGAVRESLATRLRNRPTLPADPAVPAPPVAELLDIDREYRAQSGQLPRIAPRRFNPTAARWLPVLHTERAGRHYTALYSNTARAHRLGMVHDWVVIYRDDHAGDGQWTLVTARTGPLKGRRIVRGREAESEAYYAGRPFERQQLLPLGARN